MPDVPDWYRHVPKTRLGNISRLGAIGSVAFGLPGRRNYSINLHRLRMFNGHADEFYFYEPTATVESTVNAVAAIEKYPAFRCDYSPGSTRVMLTVDIFSGAFDAPQGILMFPEVNERPMGWHSVEAQTLAQVKGNVGVTFRHSWSVDDPEWGWNGVGFVSKEYMEEYLVEGWARRWLRGPNAAYLGGQDQLTSTPASMGAWHSYRDGQDFRDSILSDEAHYRESKVMSLVADEEVYRIELIEPLEDGNLGRTAWCHVRLRGPVAIIEEFFVWTAYRQSGRGTRMFLFLMTKLADAGYERFEWLASTADCTAQRLLDEPPYMPGWLSSFAWTSVAPRLSMRRSAAGQPVDYAQR